MGIADRCQTQQERAVPAELRPVKAVCKSCLLTLKAEAFCGPRFWCEVLLRLWPKRNISWIHTGICCRWAGQDWSYESHVGHTEQDQGALLSEGSSINWKNILLTVLKGNSGGPPSLHRFLLQKCYLPNEMQHEKIHTVSIHFEYIHMLMPASQNVSTHSAYKPQCVANSSCATEIFCPLTSV